MRKIAILLAICFTCAVAWLSGEQQTELKKFDSECSKDIGITIENVQQALTGETEVGEKVKCFAKCVLKKTQIMNEDGTINEHVIRQKVPKDVPQDEVNDIIQKCLKIDGDTDCDKAAEFLKCTVKTIAIKELS